MLEELVEALRRQPGMMQTALTQTFVGHARVVGPGERYRDAIVSAPPNDRIPVGASPVYDAVHRTPWGGRCRNHRAEDLEGETWDRRHGRAQGIGAESIRA